MAEANINIGIESTVHAALLKFVQRVYDEYGVRITNADFEWMELASIPASSFAAVSVQITSTRRRYDAQPQESRE
jgi:type II secretory pathway component PulM